MVISCLSGHGHFRKHVYRVVLSLRDLSGGSVGRRQRTNVVGIHCFRIMRGATSQEKETLGALDCTCT